MMETIRNFLQTPRLLDITQIVLAVLVALAILVQSQGAGLGSAFGGEGNVYRTRRGAEVILHRATIVFLGLFFLVALLNVLF